jgi:hypothetical protein
MDLLRVRVEDLDRCRAAPTSRLSSRPPKAEVAAAQSLCAYFDEFDRSFRAKVNASYGAK